MTFLNNAKDAFERNIREKIIALLFWCKHGINMAKRCNGVWRGFANLKGRNAHRGGTTIMRGDYWDAPCEGEGVELGDNNNNNVT